MEVENAVEHFQETIEHYQEFSWKGWVIEEIFEENLRVFRRLQQIPKNAQACGGIVHGIPIFSQSNENDSNFQMTTKSTEFS